jgi:cell division protein FtsN
MARDYKHRGQQNAYGRTGSRKRGEQRKRPNILGRWLLVFVLLAAFIGALNMIRQMIPALLSGKTSADVVASAEQAIAKKTETINLPGVVAEKTVAAVTTKTEDKAKAKPAAAEPEQPEEPHFDFYTILPQAETVVPDHEIKSRAREQLVGKAKAAQYLMQAGSFRNTQEAEQQKAKLAGLGIQSRVEAAKIGNVLWYRVKFGPYDSAASVSSTKDLLQKNGISVVVTESGKQ